MGADATEGQVKGRTAKAKAAATTAEVTEEENGDNGDLLQNFAATYTVNAEEGTCVVTFKGEATFTITEGRFPEGHDKAGELCYISPIVRNAQPSLKEALEWTGRQLTVKAVNREYKRQNPDVRMTKAEREAHEQRIFEAKMKVKDATIDKLAAQLRALGLDPEAILLADEQVPELSVVK
jgi:hypothetical protein